MVERDEQRVIAALPLGSATIGRSDETAAQHEQHRSEVLAERADRFGRDRGRDLRFTRAL